MSDQEMFGNETPNPNSETPNPSQPNPFADQLSGIKNENGEPKYKDVEAALNALSQSQQHIKTLESERATQGQELDQARQDLAKMGSIDDFVKKISPNAAPTNPSETPVVSSLSEEKVVSILQEQMQRTQEVQVQDANLKSVIAQLSQIHGEKASSMIKQKAVEMNTTPQALQDLAKSNPAMALAVLGGGTSSPTQPSRGTTIPPISSPDDNPIPKWDRGIARGGLTNSELMERVAEAKKYTYKRLGLDI